MELLPFGMFTEEVQDTLQETDVPQLNFIWVATESVTLKLISVCFRVTV